MFNNFFVRLLAVSVVLQAILWAIASPVLWMRGEMEGNTALLVGIPSALIVAAALIHDRMQD